MANVNLGKVIEKIISKIRKEEAAGGRLLDIPPTPKPTSGRSAPVVPPRVYLKASTLHSLEDLNNIKSEVKSGNILILRLDILAEKSVDDVKRAVGELSEFAGQIGGDIARLGDERIVVTPSFVRVWREKTVEPEKPESRTSTGAE